MAEPRAPQRDTEVVFRDLEHSYVQLQSRADSPADLRREFRTFVDLSQQLTEVMRREFHRETRHEWVAGAFAGWTPITSLLKKLRGDSFHGTPFLVDVQHEQIFSVGPQPDGRFIGIGLQSTVEVSDATQTTTPAPGMALYDNKSQTPFHQAQHVSRCILRGRTKDVRKALAAAGTSDVLKIAASAIKSFRAYYSYYQDELAANTSGKQS